MRFLSIVLLVTSLMLPGCATTNRNTQSVIDPGFYDERLTGIDFMDIYDPWEGFNRRTYAFNAQFDRFVFLPLVKGYRAITPKWLRTGVTNFWNNIAEVETTAASLLQLRFKKAGQSTGRFAINSTLGIGGLVDVATKMKVYKDQEDFGQVLGHWGIGAGPYLVIPFLGPSSVRDGVGKGLNFATARAVNLAGMPQARRDHTWLAFFYAVSLREATPFRYGQLKSPFEYEMVRFAATEARVILVEE